MDTNKILYRNFLDNKHVYNLNVGYWRKKLERELNEEISFKNKNQLISNRDKNGRNFYDGNPIFSYYNCRQKKAIRIIQENPDDINNYHDIKLIEAWIDKLPLCNQEILELVVSLYLTQETSEKCMDVVKKWMMGELNNDNIDEYIQSLVLA